MSETLFGPKQLHSWAAALFARPEASLAHKGLCLFINVDRCKNKQAAGPGRLPLQQNWPHSWTWFFGQRIATEIVLKRMGWWWSSPLPIVNQSLDQKLLQPFSLSPTLFWWETNDPTPDVKLLAWKWGKGEKGWWSLLLDKSGIGRIPSNDQIASQEIFLGNIFEIYL